MKVEITSTFIGILTAERFAHALEDAASVDGLSIITNYDGKPDNNGNESA